MKKARHSTARYAPFAFAISLGSLLVKTAVSAKKSEEILDGLFWVFAIVAVMSVLAYVCNHLVRLPRRRRKVSVDLDVGSVSESKVRGAETKDADADVRLKAKGLKKSDITGFSDSEKA